jgi:hypothetical protein
MSCMADFQQEHRATIAMFSAAVSMRVGKSFSSSPRRGSSLGLRSDLSIAIPTITKAPAGDPSPHTSSQGQSFFGGHRNSISGDPPPGVAVLPASPGGPSSQPVTPSGSLLLPITPQASSGLSLSGSGKDAANTSGRSSGQTSPRTPTGSSPLSAFAEAHSGTDSIASSALGPPPSIPAPVPPALSPVHPALVNAFSGARPSRSSIRAVISGPVLPERATRQGSIDGFAGRAARAGSSASEPLSSISSEVRNPRSYVAC